MNNTNNQMDPAFVNYQNIYYYNNVNFVSPYPYYYPPYGYPQQEQIFQNLYVRKAKDPNNTSTAVEADPAAYPSYQVAYQPYEVQAAPVDHQKRSRNKRKDSNQESKRKDSTNEDNKRKSQNPDEKKSDNKRKGSTNESKRKTSNQETTPKYVPKASPSHPPPKEHHDKKEVLYVPKEEPKVENTPKQERKTEAKTSEPKVEPKYVEKKVQGSPWVEKKQEPVYVEKKTPKQQNKSSRKGSEQIKDSLPIKKATITYQKDSLLKLFEELKGGLKPNPAVLNLHEDIVPIVQQSSQYYLELEHIKPCDKRLDSAMSFTPKISQKASPYVGGKNRKDSYNK